jgi:hypothetical protein
MKLELYPNNKIEYEKSCRLYVVPSAAIGLLYFYDADLEYYSVYVNPQDRAEGERFVAEHEAVRNSPLMKALE